jgi:uncharacterized membrane protein
MTLREIITNLFWDRGSQAVYNTDAGLRTWVWLSIFAFVFAAGYSLYIHHENTQIDIQVQKSISKSCQAFQNWKTVSHLDEPSMDKYCS